MNGKKKNRAPALLSLGTALALGLLLAGCAGLNDNPGPSYSLTVPVGQLVEQLGYTNGAAAGNALSQPVVSDAQSEVITLLVGAIVIRSRTVAQGPYTDSTPVTDVGEELADDLANSADNLTLIYLDELTEAVDTVSISLPPPASEKWQVVAAGLSTKPGGILDLSEETHQNAINYFAFDPRFLETGTDGNVYASGDSGGTVIEVVEMTMRRACLIATPPNGCAQYDYNGDIQLTGAVEVISVSATPVDGTAAPQTLLNSGTYPLIVTDAASVTAAKSNLNGILTLEGNAGKTLSNWESITVEATHQKANDASPDCQNATDVDGPLGLRANCDVVNFTINLQ